MKTSFFKNVSNLEDLRKEYRRLAFLFHPDRGGDTATMQQINAEYEYLSDNLIFSNESFDQERKDYEYQVSEDMKQKINDLINLQGITLEIIGSWLWVTGLTYPVREKLKQSGFCFSHNKVAWFYHSGEYRKKSRRRFELDDIRGMFGSQIIENENKKVNQLAY